MANDWWQRKLGSGQQQQVAPAYRPSTPHYNPPPPPPPMTGVPEQYAPQGAIDEGQVPLGVKLQQHYSELPPQAVGNRTETDVCPGCGGGNYFSRSMGVTRGPKPAPECFDCGYPLVQAGSGLGSLGASSASGPAHFAPQAAHAGPPMGTVIAHL